MGHYRRVPFIQSPLVSSVDVVLLLVPKTCQENSKEHPSEDEEPQVEAHDVTLFENPQFQHYEETSNIQLFFDLFFVANLTSFTNAHEVNSTSSMFLLRKAEWFETNAL